MWLEKRLKGYLWPQIIYQAQGKILWYFNTTRFYDRPLGKRCIAQRESELNIPAYHGIPVPKLLKHRFRHEQVQNTV